MSEYKPSQKTIDRYADVMVHYALNGGKGIRKGDTVLLTAHETAKPLFFAVREKIWKAGGHVISRYIPNEDSGPANLFLLKHGNIDQLNFFPKEYYKGLLATVDHTLYIISDEDLHILEGVESKKIGIVRKSMAPYMEMRRKKEEAGKLTWTLCLYGTKGMAKEAGMSYQNFWKQIEKACYLDTENPVKKWQQLEKDIQTYIKKLNKLDIETFHILGKDVDLNIKLGERRRFLGGRGYNIPSFEIFCSPDWRGTNGRIKFNEPLYYSGQLIKDIELFFENGKVVKATASKNQKTLREMIAVENADKVGEFSLTDKRFSRINKFMANTLYDENFGGKYGNTHIALGNSYRDSYDGDIKKVSESGWKKLGFNKCDAVHTDIISTSDRVVTATLKNGREKVIYKNGQFVI
ncbi:aminopeptidase [Candidatus Nomurabacteria bacterium]|nr:aminopeptidase [Candidatus Nomurabacteria bacterium]